MTRDRRGMLFWLLVFSQGNLEQVGTKLDLDGLISVAQDEMMLGLVELQIEIQRQDTMEVQVQMLIQISDDLEQELQINQEHMMVPKVVQSRKPLKTFQPLVRRNLTISPLLLSSFLPVALILSSISFLLVATFSILLDVSRRSSPDTLCRRCYHSQDM